MHNCCNSLRIFSLIILLSVASMVEAAQSFIVSDIRLEGLEKIPQGTLLNYLPVIQGDPLDDKQVVFAIRELYKTGFFADVQLFRDGDVLVVDTRNFAFHRSPYQMGVPSGNQKHVVERYQLIEDGAQAELPGGTGVLADVDGELAHPLDDVEDLLACLLGDEGNRVRFVQQA